MIPLNLEGNTIGLFAGVADLAIAMQDGRAANAAADLLLALLDTVAEAQDEHSGGLPQHTTKRSEPYYEHTTWEDAVSPQAMRGLLALHRKVNEAGGRLAERVTANHDVIGMARKIADNGERTVDALGYLPGRTLAADPTQPAKGRLDPDIPLDAADLKAMVATCNALYDFYKTTGEEHPLYRKLVTRLDEYRRAMPGAMPTYLKVTRENNPPDRVAVIYELAPIAVKDTKAFNQTWDGAGIDGQSKRYWSEVAV